MYFDRMDIVEAYCLFFTHYHSGQSSWEYERLCGILKYFKPSPIFRFESLSENAREIYNALVEKAEQRFNEDRADAAYEPD